MTAQQAFDCGLVNKIVERGQLDREIQAYIEKGKKLSGEVIALGKQVLNSQKEFDLEQAYQIAIRGMQ